LPFELCGWHTPFVEVEVEVNTCVTLLSPVNSSITRLGDGSLFSKFFENRGLKKQSKRLFFFFSIIGPSPLYLKILKPLSKIVWGDNVVVKKNREFALQMKFVVLCAILWPLKKKF
jgi:hypothetical protein